MREIILDTETTGLRPDQGDRICEVAALELVDHVPTGRHYQAYVKPDIPMPEKAFSIHGLSDEFLADKPPFEDVAAEFLEFIGSDVLVAHNAMFDVRFLNSEFARIGAPPILTDRVVDTYAIARVKFPGAEVNLDALCRRFNVDRSRRTLHGALIDCELLAEVYIELIDARQTALSLKSTRAGRGDGAVIPARPQPLASPLTEEMRAAHIAFVRTLSDTPLWAEWLPEEWDEASQS